MKKQNHFNKKIFLLILLITFLIHLTYLPNGFTWLDHRDIEMRGGILPLTQIYKTFFTRFGDTGFYRPLVTIFHSLDYAIYKNWAPGYHLTNVLLHTTATAALPGFLTAFFILKPWQILLVTLIFGIHPFSILPTGQISYRPELLLALFVFLTLRFYAQARRGTKFQNKILFFIFFLATLLSKETALILIPLLIFFWESLRFKKASHLDFRLTIGVFILLLSYLFLRFQAVPEIWRISQPRLSLSQALGTRFVVFVKLLFQLIVPLKPSFSDATTILEISTPESLATLVFLSGLFFSLLRSRFRSQISTSIFLLLIFLAPSLNIIPLSRFSSPHYGYLAVSGLVALVILLVKKTYGILRFLYICIIIVWIFLASVSSFQSGHRFKNDFTLFSAEVSQDPNFLEAHYYLGYYHLSKGDLTSAKKHYQSILTLPKNVIVFADRFAFFLNLGNISLLEKRLSGAKQYFDKSKIYATSSTQKTMLAYNKVLLAQSLYSAGKKEEARNLVQEILPLLSTDLKEKIKKNLEVN